ncbi:Tropomyosin [Eufriesea mexicana]|uniref:Tropomyosin n=1 Tax=Eufriesea mexicana TaxID=516756 RepID=A0A310SBZ1_9HYME|nr:Tropomyosin [Eufriesea mexicana]
MDAIKKKMQGMKLEKDNAMDRALLCEQQARDANARAEKAEEEARALQKKIQTIENELDQTQEALMQVNAKLEEKDKALQNGWQLVSMEPALTSTTRRRGHQHHPRHVTRRRLDASSRGPAQCGPADIVKDSTIGNNDASTTATSPRLDEKSSVIDTECSTAMTVPMIGGARWHRDPTVAITTKDAALHEDTSKIKNNFEEDNREGNIRHRLAQCSLDILDERHEHVHERNKNDSYDSYETERVSGKSQTRPRGDEICKDQSVDETKSKDDSPEPEHAVARARGDGNSDDESINVEEDPEHVELAKLRCPSERAEVQAEREARRRKRCADYPGLAFGWAIFSSDTMMKFDLIRNELKNILENQLKRVSIA